MTKKSDWVVAAAVSVLLLACVYAVVVVLPRVMRGALEFRRTGLEAEVVQQALAGNLADAKARCALAVKLDRRDVAAMCLHGYLSSREAAWEDARTSFEQSLAVPRALWPQPLLETLRPVAQAYLLLAQNNWYEALEAFRDTAPGKFGWLDEVIAYGHARAGAQVGWWDPVAAYLSQHGRVSSFGDVSREGQVVCGRLLFLDGEADLAYELLLSGADTENELLRQQAARYLAWIEYFRGDFENALRWFEEAGWPKGIPRAVDALHRLGRDDEARKHYWKMARNAFSAAGEKRLVWLVPESDIRTSFVHLQVLSYFPGELKGSSRFRGRFVWKAAKGPLPVTWPKQAFGPGVSGAVAVERAGRVICSVPLANRMHDSAFEIGLPGNRVPLGFRAHGRSGACSWIEEDAQPDYAGDRCLVLRNPDGRAESWLTSDRFAIEGGVYFLQWGSVRGMSGKARWSVTWYDDDGEIVGSFRAFSETVTTAWTTVCRGGRVPFDATYGKLHLANLAPSSEACFDDLVFCEIPLVRKLMREYTPVTDLAEQTPS